MSMRRRRTGRLTVPFGEIEKLAALAIADSALAGALAETWTLTRHSALHRCKDGSYTLHLVWHGSAGTTMTSTTRGLVLEDA